MASCCAKSFTPRTLSLAGEESLRTTFLTAGAARYSAKRSGCLPGRYSTSRGLHMAYTTGLRLRSRSQNAYFQARPERFELPTLRFEA